jgi:hypothetical protein
LWVRSGLDQRMCSPWLLQVRSLLVIRVTENNNEMLEGAASIGGPVSF